MLACPLCVCVCVCVCVCALFVAEVCVCVMWAVYQGGVGKGRGWMGVEQRVLAGDVKRGWASVKMVAIWRGRLVQRPQPHYMSVQMHQVSHFACAMGKTTEPWGCGMKGKRWWREENVECYTLRHICTSEELVV